jgi:hypothetical protein
MRPLDDERRIIRAVRVNEHPIINSDLLAGPVGILANTELGDFDAI